MKRNERLPSYTEALKTIKRSIHARGGIAQEERVIHALVWNYYKHLPWAEKKKLGLEPPRSWNAADYIAFKQQLATRVELTALVKQAKDHIWYATAVENVVKIVFISNKDNKANENACVARY